ncbi:hypothetical protein BH11PSE8_BH11PSE8_27660 [soil metagenome]
MTHSFWVRSRSTRGCRFSVVLRVSALAGILAAASVVSFAGSSAGMPKQGKSRGPDNAIDMGAAVASASNLNWHGESLSELAVRWNRWFESIPAGVVPHGDSSGANCGISQSGQIWFLSGPLGGTFVNACTIPAGKAIMAPVFNVIDDYPCPAEFEFEPKPGQGLEAFLTADAAQYVNLDYRTALLDGAPLRVHRVRTPLFGFTAAASKVASDPCITGSPQLAVSDGYYVFIDPPARGQHVLQLRSAPSVFGGATDVTINLTIK